MKFVERLWRLARTVLPIVVGVSLLVLVLAWVAGVFTPKIEPTDTSQSGTVRRLTGQPTVEVKEVPQQTFVEAVGTLRAASRTVIAAKVLATIDEITVSAGDQVVADQVLIRLDTQELDSRVQQAEQQLAAAKATLGQAESDFRRAANTMRDNPGAISRQEFDAKQTRLQVARARLLQAEHAVTEATVLRSYSTISAPKAGRIVDRLSEAGDIAKPGEPLLIIYDALSLRLEAPVMESLAGTLEIGQPVSVHIDALKKDFLAQVDEIVPQATAASRSFLVKVRLPRTDDMYEGMFGRLKVPVGERRFLCLATDAIYRVGQLEYVDVVTADDVLERRMIKTGRSSTEGRIEVLSGLQAGERVVVTVDAESSSGKGDS